MKTKKSKKSKAGKKIKSSVSEPGLVLTAQGDYREGGFEFWPRPTEWQLAQLAAQLARAGKVDAKQLVHDAWEIYWEGCRKIQDDHRAQKADFERESATAASLDDSIHQRRPAVPEPRKYPVAFREIETLLLPKQKGRTANRAHLIREYVLSELLGTCLALRPRPHLLTYWELDAKARAELREHFSGQVAAKFGHYRAQLFAEDAYVRFADSFLKWHRQYIAEKRSAAAHTRWAKEEEKRKAAATAAGFRAASQKRINKSLGDG